MKLRFALGVLCSGILLQACNTGSESTRPAAPIKSAPQAISSNNTSPEDQKYADLLQKLSTRDPLAEAQQAIAKGDHFLLGYYSGRAGLKMPGLNSEQQANHSCKLSTIDGLGDVIYGENHMNYRSAIISFAKAFNTKMLDVCKNS